jgi:uncharacterized protein
MITVEQRAEMVRYWWQKSGESFSSAIREFEAKSNTYAMNRLYYSAFYGVCALLLESNFSFKKHSGVRAAFHRQFLKTGILNVKWGRLYDQLFEDRQEGDYIVFVSFEHEYVKAQLKNCSEFLNELSKLLAAIKE